MDNASQRKQVPVTQVCDTLEKTVANLDQARAADLHEMSQVRTAKFTGLARDRIRLAAKLGATHPRVVALDRSLAIHGETAVGFRSESAAASVDPPRVKENSWALHGNVLNAARAPIQDLTVALYKKNIWVQALGYACTDANGYFVLPVADATKTDTGPLSITVLRSGKVIYADPNPVTIQGGHVEYREIIISKPQDVCAPPAGKQDAPTPPAQPSELPLGRPPSPEGSERAGPTPKRGSDK